MAADVVDYLAVLYLAVLSACSAKKKKMVVVVFDGLDTNVHLFIFWSAGLTLETIFFLADIKKRAVVTNLPPPTFPPHFSVTNVHLFPMHAGRNFQPS